MWLVAGLGNPGPKYQRNRHNIGFMVVDELARRAGTYQFRQKFGGEAAGCQLGRDSALLLKPMEFMNLSGYAVQRAASFHKIAPASMIVIHDEVDLEVGRLRLKTGGGHGGHNGLRSIADQLGSKEFLRVRVGVGRPGPNAASVDAPTDARGGDRKISGWVLSDFPNSEDEELSSLVTRAADATESIIDKGMRAAMNEFNADPKKKQAKKKKKSDSPASSLGEPTTPGEPS